MSGMNMFGLNLHNVVLAKTAGLPEQLDKFGLPQIALAGRSNVGKSSLVNSLIGRKALARVSSQPGKTITVNYYSVDKKLCLVDLPGYGYAKRSRIESEKWSALTQNFFEQNSVLRLVMLLIDMKAGITENDQIMLDYLDHYQQPYVIIATKCDRFNKTELAAHTNALVNNPALLPGTEIFLSSASKNIGREQIWERIVTAARIGEE